MKSPHYVLPAEGQKELIIPPLLWCFSLPDETTSKFYSHSLWVPLELTAFLTVMFSVISVRVQRLPRGNQLEGKFPSRVTGGSRSVCIMSKELLLSKPNRGKNFKFYCCSIHTYVHMCFQPLCFSSKQTVGPTVSRKVHCATMRRLMLIRGGVEYLNYHSCWKDDL